MKEIKPNSIYRIDRPMECARAVSFLTGDDEVIYVCTDDLKDKLSKTPDVFPFVVVFSNVNFSKESAVLSADVEFISIGCFANRDDQIRLFEFDIKRTYTETWNVRVSKYQVPARDIIEAHVKLGQAFHNDDSYELEVLSCNQVR